MSYSSVLQVTSNGDLGAFVTSGAFADTPLVSGAITPVSNTIALELGVWALNVRLQFTTNADDTTEIQSLISQSINEAGLQNTNTLIWNGETAGAYVGFTKIYNYWSVIVASATGNNEFTQNVTWTGVGSAPSANVILNAYKLI